MPPALLIFDCDGVLIDSEIISNRVMAEALSDAGYPCTPAESVERFVGLHFAAVAERVRADTGIDIAPEFGAIVRDRTIARFPAELSGIPGVAAAIGAMGLPCCVASSSAMAWIELGLQVAGLHGHFAPHIFNAPMVARGKPAPDLFLYAAQSMGIVPADCLVIEDSVAGVTGAAAAGMRVFGFVGGGHAAGPVYRQRLIDAGAELVFDEMAALPGLVAAMDDQAEAMRVSVR